MKTCTSMLGCAGLILMLAGVGMAEDLTADAIVAKANRVAYYAGKDGRAAVRMTITDGKGGTRVREFAILRLNTTGENQKFYVFFREPADVRKMAFLVWKNVDGEDDRWLWLPALNLTRRIAPGDKRTSFVGSDFLYEDVSGRNLNEDTHELVETTDTQYVIRNTPRNPGSVEFKSYTVWIDKDTFLPRKAEYLDANGACYRRVEGLKVEMIQGHPTVMESAVSDLVSGSRTVNTFTRVEYDIGLTDGIFTERFLRRPPREVEP
ncbi:MAG: outer membrane lipoprotein-sorting protein [Lentisphaerae bacterium RIFOXYC12_FULL_60_16]|nr:MAG: outer membrane lipoprotein-sorting protein [Lentisphaerae bacterium RIFOXYC12_FULL_60_16]OGV72831.1 MAG: outer membrane lipoprotein-sorting protein [Lentisphaerae bacterium RIFOXYA12_FULL_60_10]